MCLKINIFHSFFPAPGGEGPGPAGEGRGAAVPRAARLRHHRRGAGGGARHPLRDDLQEKKNNQTLQQKPQEAIKTLT